MRKSSKNHRKFSNGFTLIELMIGLTIALVFLLIVGVIFTNANQQKSTTSSGADAQTSGALGSHMVERDLRMAGYGINISDLLACEIYAYDETISPARNFTMMAVPVIITKGNTTQTSTNPYGTPDTIAISYATSDTGFSLAQLTSANNGGNANYKVSNRFGFHEGDIIVVVEPVDRYTPDATTGAPTLGANGINDCVLSQVTGVPGGGNSDNIIHNSGNYTDASGKNVPAQYNKPSGLGISFTTNAKIFNFGSGPVNVTYGINTKSELTRQESFSNTAAQAVADNIIMLRAYYGRDTNGDGTVDSWNQTTPTTSADWKTVLAVQFAVVARSQKKEATAVTSSPITLWSGGPTLTLSADQQKYRYKVFSSLVALRNMIWSGS